MHDRDELDDYLDNFVPDEKLVHATLEPYLNDPIARARMLKDSSCQAPLIRSGKTNGVKVMDGEELGARAFQFFEENHTKWAAHFRDYVIDRGVSATKLDTFIESFATLWVDGRSTRQDSPQMLSIKASIRDLDVKLHPTTAGRFVVNQLSDNVAPLLAPDEMAAIFGANAGLITGLFPDYVDALGVDGPGSVENVYVRRGVKMEHPGLVLRELNYLSSYSLALGPVEQFAQTGKSRDNVFASIFSAPISAIQHRMVAFAPFIEGMSLSQLEFVVAPPWGKTPLTDHGVHGEIREFSFE